MSTRCSDAGVAGGAVGGRCSRPDDPPSCPKTPTTPKSWGNRRVGASGPTSVILGRSLPPDRRVERAMPGEIGTIGHSNRELREFLGRLAASAIGRVADMWRFPGSRRQPHFNREALDATLGRVGIGSRRFGDLGGQRDGGRPGRSTRPGGSRRSTPAPTPGPRRRSPRRWTS